MMRTKMLMIGSAVFLLLTGYFVGTFSNTFGGESNDEEINFLIDEGYIHDANQMRQKLLSNTPRDAMRLLSEDGSDISANRADALDMYVLYPSIPSTLEIARQMRKLQERGMSRGNAEKILRSGHQ